MTGKYIEEDKQLWNLYIKINSQNTSSQQKNEMIQEANRIMNNPRNYNSPNYSNYSNGSNGCTGICNGTSSNNTNIIGYNSAGSYGTSMSMF